MHFIKTESIKNSFLNLIDKNVTFKSSKAIVSKLDNRTYSPQKSLIKRDSSKFDKRMIRHTFTNETNQSEKNKKRKEVIFRIADELFARNQTLTDILNHKIYDKVINGKEYQIISKGDMLNCFRRIGIDFDERDKRYLNDLLAPIFSNFIDVKVLENILQNLGIYEDIPSSNNQIDFNMLEGSTIRFCNKIIRYMKENDIIDVSELIKKNEIDLVNIVSKDKEHMIEVIQFTKFQDILLSKDIIKHREELDEKLVELIQLNYDYSDVLIIKKLQKIISKIQKHKYFKQFGFEMRVFEDKKSHHKVIAMGKRHSHMLNHELLSKNLSFGPDIKDITSNEADDNINKKIKVSYIIYNKL